MKKVLKWLDNFWYHNRWIVLIAAFFIISIAVMLTQFVGKDDYDIMVLYTGPRIPNAMETRDLQDAFGDIIKEDRNGDGKHIVALNSLFLMTDQQLKDKKYTTNEEGEPIMINTAEMVNTRHQFSTQIFVGEALICLLDPAWYDVAKKQDAFVPLSELTDTLPDTVYDDSALYLRDTSFGQYFTATRALPEDTLICFRRMSSTTAIKSEKHERERYEYNRQVFVDLLNFGQ